eukprot:gnl/Dysnectes_brevis/544_a601_5378.p1 GENE.gnl/Dysnectes_brevis/544_a601_5378~~gnl/Dysnectes_brevis/544_a601_5378.p1  ORF type:complete len:330 (-),score=125.49 gnl/Dysnectes_brevis/544_a601_5378:37-1026(-)
MTTQQTFSVLVAENINRGVEAVMTEAGLSVTWAEKISDEDMIAQIHEFDALIVRGRKVPEAAVRNGKKLKLIVRGGAGTSNIPKPLCTELGVAACNTPGMNANAVAELTIGSLICCDRRMPRATADLVSGQWHKKAFQKARGLRGNTMGVIGNGAIARAVINTCKALGMNVIQWSRSLTPERCEAAGVGYATDIYDLARRSYAISAHLPLVKKPLSEGGTKSMFDATFFEAMQEGGIFVNMARGGCLVQADLVEAIKAKGLRVALDVFDPEPKNHGGDVFPHTELASLCECVTPHVGASTTEASIAVADECARVVMHCAHTGEIINKVN